jgi:hypothetical protein
MAFKIRNKAICLLLLCSNLISTPASTDQERITYSIHSSSGETVFRTTVEFPLSAKEIYRIVRDSGHPLARGFFRLLHGEKLLMTHTEEKEMPSTQLGHVTLTLIKAIPEPESNIEALIGQGFVVAVFALGDGSEYETLLGLVKLSERHGLRTQNDFGEFFGSMVNKPDFCVTSTIKIQYPSMYPRGATLFYKGVDLEPFTRQIDEGFSTIDSSEKAKEIQKILDQIETDEGVDFDRLERLIPIVILELDITYR